MKNVLDVNTGLPSIETLRAKTLALAEELKKLSAKDKENILNGSYVLPVNENDTPVGIFPTKNHAVLAVYDHCLRNNIDLDELANRLIPKQ
jgi:hypothetical protein